MQSGCTRPAAARTSHRRIKKESDCPDSEELKQEGSKDNSQIIRPALAGGPAVSRILSAMVAALIGAGSVYPASAMVSPWLFARLPSSSYTAINKAPRNGSSLPWL